ncbi:MAG: hypothetical protein ACOYM8_18930, partial [Caulobacterales bacterium]
DVEVRAVELPVADTVKLAVVEAEPLAEPCAVDDNKAEVVVEARAEGGGARIEVLVDARLKPIQLGSQEIHFRFAAPSRLYWADRPAMRVVQALHWMQDMLAQDGERQRVQTLLRRLFGNPEHGQAIRDDLRAGFSALPIWMQEFLRDLLGLPKVDEAQP